MDRLARLLGEHFLRRPRDLFQDGRTPFLCLLFWFLWSFRACLSWGEESMSTSIGSIELSLGQERPFQLLLSCLFRLGTIRTLLPFTTPTSTAVLSNLSQVSFLRTPILRFREIRLPLGNRSVAYLLFSFPHALPFSTYPVGRLRFPIPPIQ